ncbi:MAG TPA: ABC transporter ATP-binding protein [Deltaproteobacteria bacterium]|nr:ABC transporter ATP-binding protein [Deltaproteobacteria bacterium]
MVNDHSWGCHSFNCTGFQSIGRWIEECFRPNREKLMKVSPILTVKDLVITTSNESKKVTLLDNLSFELLPSEILSIVGESGSGKSITAKSILGLLPKNFSVSGEIRYYEKNLIQTDEKEMLSVRGHEIGLIFQEPMTALNPVLSIGEQLTESMIISRKVDSKIAYEMALEMLNRVGIPHSKERMLQFPHEFSGGMRQRILIAMMMLMEPNILIADEPTTALDVTIQAQILDLLSALVQEKKMSMILITHDMGVVAQTADRVLVMKDGKKIEDGKVEEIFVGSNEDYTKQLLASVPRLTSNSKFKENLPKSNLISIENLSKSFLRNTFFSKKKISVNALENISLQIGHGEVVSLVGESGSGKSTLGRILLKLTNADKGTIRFDGLDFYNNKSTELKKFRSTIQIIFQDPYSSLDPKRTIGYSISEPLIIQNKYRATEIQEKVRKLLTAVGIDPDSAKRYPHEFSGGQRQRIAIARAISTEPKIIVADEPTSALDVTVQAQILELLLKLKDEQNISFLFISHDLAVVQQVSDSVAVLCEGRILEKGSTSQVLQNPLNGYTKSLINSVPIPDPTKRQKLKYTNLERSFNRGPLLEVEPNHWVAQQEF